MKYALCLIPCRFHKNGDDRAKNMRTCTTRDKPMSIHDNDNNQFL